MAAIIDTPRHLRLEEVRRHSTEDDCWIIVHSRIYDVSAFRSEHPGGSAIIMKYAGRDATAAYDEIHAPDMIASHLPPDRMQGLLDEADTKLLAEQRIAEDVDASKALASPSAAEAQRKTYSKPDLFKLISVKDFEEVARKLFTAKAYAFYSSAATDLVTHGMNADFYRRILIRPRVLRNVEEVKIRRGILGYESSAPFFVSPAAMAKLAHPDGELALAQGCAAEDIIQIVSLKSRMVEIF